MRNRVLITAVALVVLCSSLVLQGCIGGAKDGLSDSAYGSTVLELTEPAAPTRSPANAISAEVLPATENVDAEGTQADQWGTGVYVNSVELLPAQLAELEDLLGGQLTPGSYWYDQYGTFGMLGSPYGINLERLAAAKVATESPTWGTGVYINEQELTPPELAVLENLLGDVSPGQYWLDQHGNFGVVGNSQGVNLSGLAAQEGWQSSSPEGWIREVDGVGSQDSVWLGGQGDCFYFNSDDYTYLSPGCE